WRNWEVNTFLAVHDLRFVSFGGPDADSNGVPDWKDHRASESSSLGALPVESLVSPVCVEGRDLWRDVLEVEVAYPGTNAVFATVKTIGDGFYADIPLPEDGAATVSLRGRSPAESFNVAWKPFDVFAEDYSTNALVVRTGDALRIAPHDGGESEVTVSVADGTNGWSAVTNWTETTATPYAFEEPGTYLVTVAREGLLGGDAAHALVEAVRSRFPKRNPAVLMDAEQTLDCPELSPRNVLEHDAELQVAAEAAGSGVTLSLLTHADRDLGLVSRLPDGGAISDAVQVTPMWADNGTYYRVADTFADGSQLVEVSLLLGAVAEGMTVDLEIFVSGVTFDDGTYVLGAPDIILRDVYGTYRDRIEEHAAKGLRVVALARVISPASGAQALSDSTGMQAEPVLFVLLENPLRTGAEETFRFFGKQGVGIRVISGDNPLTVSKIAQRAGIPGAEHFIDASAIESDVELDQAIRETIVFGRVTPEMKQRIIRALKRAGHTVAMTGDGVNDILAMKDADCSVAMAAGSDAAVQAAQVVLLDSDFSRMPHIVAEGRRDINNVERSASLFLVKNLFSLLLSVYTIASVRSYPLEPSQISLVSMFNIGVPAFFLAMEPNTKRVGSHFMRRVLIKAMPAALTAFIAIAAMVVFGEEFLVSGEDISIASTYLLAIVGFMILFRISAPLNRYRTIVITACIAGIILFSFVLGDLYAVSMVSKRCLMLFAVFAIATEPLMRYLTMLSEKAEQVFARDDGEARKMPRGKRVKDKT
ncbi:MAG: HAD-IC family P-type ATPase, partial [Butyrivibrio sp.]|nr:HAD-IC family P-type ATPase [Butyrivibrio sp.]